jgi:aminoglycoside 6'-N-acetyltransferase I
MPVRPLRDDDRPQVGTWKLELWGEDAWPGGETVLVWDDGDGTLGGFISLTVRPWANGCDSSPVPFVEGWYVAANGRRRGIGRALMAAAEGWARAEGFTELGSDVLLENTASLQAHRQVGFQPTEQVQYFRKDLGLEATRGRARWVPNLKERPSP